MANLEKELQILNGSHQIPVGLHLVGNLVVIARRVFGPFLTAKPVRLAYVLNSRMEI